MLNETINSASSVVSSNPDLMGLATVVGSLMSTFVFIIIIFCPRIKIQLTNYSVKRFMKKIKQETGKNVLVMSHVQSGIFGQMITTADLMKIEKELRKFKGNDVMMILNTPGGDLFASIKIANLMKNYEGKVTAIIPKYAMSGGTLISLGADEILMDKNASMGPVDPQLGSLFKSFSSRGWNEIVNKKGKKADDESIGLSFLGNQATRIVEEALDKLIEMKDKKIKKRVINHLISGDIAH